MAMQISVNKAIPEKVALSTLVKILQAYFRGRKWNDIQVDVLVHDTLDNVIREVNQIDNPSSDYGCSLFRKLPF